MAQSDSDRALQQCLLDRLIDLEPASNVEPPSTRAQSLRQFKAAVRRDLEWLLNTHRSIDVVPETYQELPKSVFVYGLPDLADFVSYGASPRATLALLGAARGRAFLAGRGYVVPEDVKDVAPDVLRHRVLLSYEAEAENVTSDQVVKRILERVEVP